MTRIEKLRQMGLSFNQPRCKCETLAMREQCKNIYYNAFKRVSAKADYVDRIRALSVDQFPEPILSEIFKAKDRELCKAIDAEWLSDYPEMKKFEFFVNEWERLCLQELKAWKGEIE